jgi:D-alanyl-D-alanine dipeptidase
MNLNASRTCLRVYCVAGLLLIAALGINAQTGPPKDPKATRQADLVELVTLDPTIRLDIRYAGTNNFLGKPVYPEARAFLQRPAAQALLAAHRDLAAHGYGLLIHDGYRPWAITKLFWDMTSGSQREFVADPAQGSKHNRGCAVDLTMYDLALGTVVEMPSGYDEMTPRAYPDYKGGQPEARGKRDLLRWAMEKHGFTVEPNEWWHFNYKDWQEFPILDMPFSAIK